MRPGAGTTLPLGEKDLDSPERDRGICSWRGEECCVRYLIVAEAYRDLEQLSSRLALTERLAALVAETPAELLPTVCYLCQGLIAPEFAGVDLGLAEKLAVRAVAAVAGVDAAEVAALVREAGDLGQAAERLLAPRSAAAGGLEVGQV